MNRKPFLWLLIAFAVAANRAEAQSGAAHAPTLWYRHPASKWEEALPVGNGRLGAMVFGGVATEQIQLNENTIWSGSGGQSIPEGAYKSLPEIRQLLFAGNYAAAEALVRSNLLIGPGAGNSYQTMGDLLINTGLTNDAVEYRRWPDLDSGLAVTILQAGDGH